MRSKCALRTLTVASIICAAVAVTTAATADGTAPLSYIADPAVYKLLGENETFRVVLATWKPGQRDAYHSHSELVAYRLTDCKGRGYRSDGTVAGEGDNKLGSLRFQKAVASHSVENIGSTECRVLIVERK
jgi:hypothetical protein